MTIYQFNKQDAAGRAETAAAGKTPALRTICNGSTFLKVGLQLASKDNSFHRVKKEIGGIQLGLGECGPEIMAHLARALVARGYAATTQDAIKAFHTLSRQALLDYSCCLT